MSSEEFTPEAAKKQAKRDNLAKARAAKAEKATAKAETATKPDKLAIAAERRKKSKDNFRKSGALVGQKLVAPQRPGFFRYWANDHKGKLERMEDKGYTFVQEGAANAPFEATSTNPGSKVSQRVDYADGQPMHAYLMEIPEEFHKQDQQEKETDIQTTAEALRQGGNLGSKAYVPEGASQYELPKGGS